MIGLTFNVENIDTVFQVYDQIQVIRYDDAVVSVPDTPVGQPEMLEGWTVVSGSDTYPVPVELVASQTYYQTYDPIGEASDWFSSRYYDTSTGSYSAWSEPMLGGEGDLYVDPTYPAENEIETEDAAIIKRIRILIGDPKGLRRESGEEALASVHPDRKTFELAEKGWPVFITVGGQSFTDEFNPTVNGYRYLKFQTLIDEICEGCYSLENVCGEDTIRKLEFGIDIWYYTFRHSDRQILEAYDSCPPPVGLTSTTATSQAYILQTAIDLIQKELLEDANEDGARIHDEGSVYDPDPGLKVRKDILDGLKKDLKDLINSLMLMGIEGVLID